jgi:uncharacterized membrane protein YeaQ/YmgE (transglycosylase-associated protein family)
MGTFAEVLASKSGVDRVFGCQREFDTMNTSALSLIRTLPAGALIALSLLWSWQGTPMQAAEATITESVESAAKDAQKSAVEAGKVAEGKLDQVWQTIQSQRIKNRTPDEIVAWVIMGILVGGLAGTFSPYGTSGIGKLINFGFGLAGAFIGGVLAGLTRLDLGWGPVLIRYEELFLAFVGAAVIVLFARWLRNRSAKKPAAK